MTLQRFREQRDARLVERRNMMMSGWPSGWGWVDPAAVPPPGMGSMMRAGVPVTAHTSLQVDVVFTALRVLSNAVIKMGSPRAYTEGFAEDNWPYREWLNPQPPILENTWGTMWQYDGMARTVVSMALFGEAFWITLTRDRLGYPTALEVLHPAFIEARKNKVTGEMEWWYGTGTNKVQLPPEDLTHIPFMALPGAARGLSSIEYAGVAYALALAAMEYGQRWFARGASPSFVLSTEQKLGQEEVKRIAEKFLIEHSGLQASHLPLVLDSGLAATKISSTPDEAQYLNTLEYARSVIAAFFGLPAHLVGGNNDKGNVWGKTVQEQGFQLVDYTLSGYVVRLDEAFSSLLPKGQKAALDDSVITRANAADLAREIMALRTTGVEPVNEIRVHKLHKRPLPGGDDLGAPLNSNTSPAVGTVLADDLAKDEGIPAPAAVDDAGGDNG